MTLQPAQSKGTYLCFVPVFNQKLSFCLIEEQEMESSLVTQQNSDNESQFRTHFILFYFIRYIYLFSLYLRGFTLGTPASQHACEANWEL